MTSQDNTSLAALVVALAAFLIAVGQLLQQIFGTADGYRRCQSSVIGKWATKTRLRWRWTEFRFETRFTTPIIKFLPMSEQHRQEIAAKDARGREHIWLTGSSDSRVAALTPVFPSDDDSDIVGWIVLLESLQTLQWHANMSTTSGLISWVAEIEDIAAPQRSMPAVVFRERSWDLMPPELTRPLAASTVGDLIVMAHRLGLQWRDIRPGQGFIRADGNGHSLSSTTVRGYGMVVQYSNDASFERRDRWKNLMIPTEQADKMGCGIIPGSKALLIPDLPLVETDRPDYQSIAFALDELRISHEAKHWLTTQDAQNESFPAFLDIPGMICPFMPLPSSPVVHIMHPLRLRPASPCTWREGRIVLRHRLSRYIESLPPSKQSTQLLTLSHDFNTLFEHWPMELKFNMGSGWLASNAPSDTTRRFLADLRERFDRTTNFLRSLMHHSDEKSATYGYPSMFHYRDLVASHISVNYNARQQARDNLQSGRARDWRETLHMSPPMSDWMHEVAHIYADRVPMVVAQMKDRCLSDEQLVVESWWTMIFRAILWELSVVYYSPDAFPSVAAEFYGSRTPVYIA
ncbi:MAG: hypothetical protein M1820_002833 [Bogoriella megaspora]|nr:MAG: hypothetical protein M1820_002833 [Bogoriella megaspora]